MKKIMLVPLIFMFTCMTAYGDYSVEFVTEGDKEVKSEVNTRDEAVKNTGVSMNKITENYKRAMSNDDDMYVLRNQLVYNTKRKRNISGEIEDLNTKLKTLPDVVKREYEQFATSLESTDDESAGEAWISFEDAFNSRKNGLEERISVLKEDLVVVNTRIARLKLELDTEETLSNLANPFIQTDKVDEEADKNIRALRAKNNLKDIVKGVTYRETKDLLGTVQHNTIGLCEFSCGKSSCYVCNLMYGTKTN
jgi:hypothetical protein